MNRTYAGSLFLVAALVAEPAVAAAPPTDLAALRGYVEITSAQFSPDGTHLAYVLETQNFRADRYEFSVVSMDLATHQATSVIERLDANPYPAWSPDGKRFALLRSTSAGADQVFLVDAHGGVTRQLTHAPRSVERFAWRPDGSAVAYEMPDAAADAAAIAAGRDGFEVGDQDYMSGGKPTPSHLWLQPLAGGPARRLTSGPQSVPKAELIFPLPDIAPMPFFAWSPDGASIIVAFMPSAYSSDAIGAVVDVLDVKTGSLRKLTSHARLEAGGIFAPDGKRIAYAYAKDDNALAQDKMFVTPASGGNGVDWTRNLDVDAESAWWMSDGKLLVQAFVDTRSLLWILDGVGTAQTVNTGDVNPLEGELDVSKSGRIAFVGSTAGWPDEVYLMSSATSAPQRLTTYNAALAARKQGKIEGLTWQGPDGFNESGVLFYPPDFTPGKKYPLVLQIHGGPTEASVAFWRDTDWPGLPQLIAARGYLVFSPNYRGGDGQGNAYQIAIFNDAGDGPGRDVIAGVEAVKKLGIVDESRMAVSGWSYGGYMTEWLLTHYDVWKAAVAGAAPSDAFVDDSISDYNALGRVYFGASPWDSPAAMQAYRDQSPLLSAAGAKAPTLILQDRGDVRVPVVHGYEFYHALRDHHVPVSFVVYPVEGHFPNDPVRSEDIYRRWVDWLARYL